MANKSKKSKKSIVKKSTPKKGSGKVSKTSSTNPTTPSVKPPGG
jgi:hypothetical protein